MHTSHVNPSLLVDAGWEDDDDDAVSGSCAIDGGLAGLEKGSNLVDSGSNDFGGSDDRFGVGRAGSFVTPHSSQTDRLAALLKPQIAQIQLEPAVSEAEESAAEALILQSLLDVVLSRGESVCREDELGRGCVSRLMASSSLASGLARVRVILGLLLRNPA